MPILGAIGNASEYAYRPNISEIPDFFDWVDVFDATPGDTYYSGYAKITGIKSILRISITDGYSYSTTGNVFDNGQTVTFDNDRAYEATFDEYSDPNNRFTTSPGTITNNQSVNIKLTTNFTPELPKTSFDANRFVFNDFNPRFGSVYEPVDPFVGDYNTVYEPIVSVGKTTQNWIVRTATLDETPNSFEFTNLLNQTTSTISTSNYVTISGLNPYYKFGANITEGSFSGIIVDEKVALTSTQVHNGSIVKLQTISSDNFDTPKDVGVRVGTFTTTWNVKTEVENLNVTFTPPNFENLYFRKLNEIRISDQITVSELSLNSSLPVTIISSGAQYQIEREGIIVKSFDDEPIEVINEDKISLRITASSSYDTPVSAILKIGNSFTETWEVRTIVEPN